MDNNTKSFSKFSFSKFIKRKYIPIYLLVWVMIAFLFSLLLMDQTNFAKDTSVRKYLEDAGIVQEAENSSDQAKVVEEENSVEENDTTTPEDENNEGEDGERDEIDSAGKVENPEDGDGTQYQGTISTKYPTITVTKDGLGNANYTSWGQENESHWKRPSIKEGEKLNVSITANNPNNSTLYYSFDYQVPGGSFLTLKDWSRANTAKWTVPASAIGRWLYIKVSVKDADGVLRFSDCDDYAYLVYEVNPKGVAQKIYPIMSSAKDSKGNVNTNSIGSNEGLDWPNNVIRELSAGTSVTFTITASDPNGDALQYMFMMQPDGGSFDVLRNWSSSNTFTWTIPEDLAGKKVYIMASVKDSDSYLLFNESGDDYTYLIYNIK
ncbi:MAG: hypothetical protein AB9915_02925 [Candidatus Dojkabacteria bacterium]